MRRRGSFCDVDAKLPMSNGEPESTKGQFLVNHFRPRPLHREGVVCVVAACFYSQYQKKRNDTEVAGLVFL